MSTLEFVAVGLTLLTVYLTTREVIWCWPLGMVSVALYGLVFYRAQLYAEVGLQGLYFGLSAYGWWAWRFGGEARSTLQVTSARPVLRGRLVQPVRQLSIMRAERALRKAQHFLGSR